MISQKDSSMFYGKFIKVHEDERRIISEFNSPRGGFSVQFFRIKTESPLGNHYHKEKYEVFVITKGGGKLFTKNINQKGEARKTALEEGSIVKIHPFLAHCFILKTGSEMICYSSAPFDEKDVNKYTVA